MLQRKFCLALIIAAGIVAPAAMAESLQVHMVQATNSGVAKIDSGLKSFEKLLKSNLPFKRFTLVDTKTVSLPAGKPIPLKDYTLTCKGAASNLSISLSHKGRKVVNSNVKIEQGKPLIVGGFPDASDKNARVLLILSVK